MAATHFYEKDVENYRGGANRLTLTVLEKDGFIGIGLAPKEGGEPLMCAIEPEEAEKVRQALSDAVFRVGYKVRPRP